MFSLGDSLVSGCDLMSSSSVVNEFTDLTLCYLLVFLRLKLTTLSADFTLPLLDPKLTLCSLLTLDFLSDFPNLFDFLLFTDFLSYCDDRSSSSSVLNELTEFPDLILSCLLNVNRTVFSGLVLALLYVFRDGLLLTFYDFANSVSLYY